ncbi:MAG: amidohydrolase family protein [Nitrosomonadales bacterium]|nr:amidohydrolase family protein [Nitrosomonadales bacterium]
MKRRDFLKGITLASAAALGYSTYRYWPESGFTNPCLSDLPVDVTEHPLYRQIWTDIDPSQVWDCHVHIIGTGDSKSPDAPWSSPRMDSYQYPILNIQKRFYMNGGCVTQNDIDQSAISRLVALSREMKPGFKAMLYAFDWWHDEQGQSSKPHSIFYVPNSYAARVARSEPTLFEWVASIHPYRPDAIDALQKVKEEGAKAIKWLPQVMNIDPLSPKCHRFYQACVDLELPIISHAGHETALPSGNQSYGNPLRLRAALDAGVKIAMAHCASDGKDIDLDAGPHGPVRASFDLFSRLMDEANYEKLLFGEIAALPLRNHQWAIKPLLQRSDWHHRLINGSDYPLPGIMPLIDAASLHRQGLLDLDAVSFLQAIKPYNPLLFDFALKRLLHSGDIYFSPDVFHTRSFFES